MIGQTLNSRYQIGERIGKGAMGTVYKAADLQTGETVAVKVLSGDLLLDPQMIERFRREGEALRQLRHPNIVGFVDMFEHDPDPSGGAGGQHVIVMEFVSGGSLHDLLKREGPLPVDRARQIALDLCDALTRAHRLEVIHRDIKPENVLMAEDGAPRLTDFGVARLVGESTRLTGTGTQVGTPFYMSPEAWEGQPLDAQADIWSLGVVLYEMLAGQVPFGGETMAAVMNKVLTAPLSDVKQLRRDAPDWLARVVSKMLARDRKRRYQTVRQVAADLEQGVPTAAAPAPTVVASRPLQRIPVWAWAMGAIVIVGMIAGAIGLGVKRGEGTPTATAQALAADSATPRPSNTTVSVSTSTPAPTNTPRPIERGEILEQCGNDLCISKYGVSQTPTGLGANYTDFSGKSWSPDGSRIAFGACRVEDLLNNPAAGCRQDLFIASRDGKNVTAVLNDPDKHEQGPAWSPDGEWIAYEEGAGLAIVRPDGTGRKILAPSSGVTCPHFGIAWSPDSQRIAWIGGTCFEDRDGISDRVWVINRDGTGVSMIFQSADPMLAMDMIAWSPDGKSIAVQLEDGVNYLIAADCADSPAGCDESSRTKLDAFPDHWLHTFYPQWAGEAQAATPTPGSMAEQARAFAEPILNAIADREPDYQDDFENPTSGWDTVGDDTSGETGYSNGRYTLTLARSNGTLFNCIAGGDSGDPSPYYSDFVLELDTRLTYSGRRADSYIRFRESPGQHNHEIMLRSDGGFVEVLRSVDDVWTSPLATDPGTINTGQDWNRIVIVARGPEIAVIANDNHILYWRDDEYPDYGWSGSMLLGACHNETVGMQVKWDNLKVWDITSLSPQP